MYPYLRTKSETRSNEVALNLPNSRLKAPSELQTNLTVLNNSLVQDDEEKSFISRLLCKGLKRSRELELFRVGNMSEPICSQNCQKEDGYKRF